MPSRREVRRASGRRTARPWAGRARRGPRGDDQRRQLLNRLMKLNTICTYVDSCEQLAHDLEMTNTALPSEFDGLGVSSEVAVNPLSFFA